MLIVKISPEKNGARANQNGEIAFIPDGYIEIPKKLEATALTYLPWINLDIVDGVVVGVSENTQAKLEWEAAQIAVVPELTLEEKIAQLQEIIDTMLTGGAT